MCSEWINDNYDSKNTCNIHEILISNITVDKKKYIDFWGNNLQFTFGYFSNDLKRNEMILL